MQQTDSHGSGKARTALPSQLGPEPSAAAQRVLPSDLSRVPEVTRLLTRLGLGGFDTATISSLPGRNENWLGTTTQGVAVFVKQLGGAPEGSAQRLRRLISFERCITATDTVRALTTPRLLGWDEPTRLVVYERVASARTGAELAEGGDFTPELAHRAGQALAELHRLQAPGHLDGSAPPLPPTELLNALPLQSFSRASGAELEAWRLLQNDGPLIEALRGLRRQERAARPVPAHCDLRLDQFLYDGSALLLTDWEEFRKADPARDIGAFAGEWLYRAVIQVPGRMGVLPFTTGTASHRDVLATGVQALEEVRPMTRQFWAGYRAVAGTAEPGLVSRATAFAGWHLLDRFLAGAHERPQIRAAERAAAGIGRTAVLSPGEFCAALGLEARS
ncbi:class V lanthionine synthetase subunit LxmK [Streptomyces sp. CRN 30]|uniref:class V lanthionine synthetase subunit LxmK n=1 Tax=Streptomyces sp. CRN 30 TaxID=3075613 RepID=UPI002A7EC7B6|nr:class V lanthionine synthetase subunit LxmK [Streptomyces sp. CRN 30]